MVGKMHEPAFRSARKRQRASAGGEIAFLFRIEAGNLGRAFDPADDERLARRRAGMLMRAGLRRHQRRGQAALHGFGQTEDVVFARFGQLALAAAGLRHHESRRRVFDFSVAHHADRLLGLAAKQFGDRFLTRIVLAGLGTVGINAERIDARFVASHVGRRRIGAVGGDRVNRTRAEQRHVRHVVHGERSAVHAVRHALGENAGGRAVADRETVGKEQNHVFGLGFGRRGIEIPLGRHRAGGGGHSHLVAARLLDFHVADDECGTRSIHFLRHPDFAARKHFAVVLAVDFDADVLTADDLIELDLEVEAGIRHEAGAVDGIDVGGLSAGGEGEKRRRAGGAESSLVHDETS